MFTTFHFLLKAFLKNIFRRISKLLWYLILMNATLLPWSYVIHIYISFRQNGIFYILSQ